MASDNGERRYRITRGSKLGRYLLRASPQGILFAVESREGESFQQGVISWEEWDAMVEKARAERTRENQNILVGEGVITSLWERLDGSHTVDADGGILIPRTQGEKEDEPC
jgi:hypothetical protein